MTTTKKDLEHENETLQKKIDILLLRLEYEELQNCIERAKLQRRITELEEHMEEIRGNTHAIGFHQPYEEAPF